MYSKRFFILLWFCTLVLTSQTTAQVQSYHLTNEELHPAPIPYFFITGLCYGETSCFINQSDMGSIQWSVTNDKGDTLFHATGDTAYYRFKKRGAFNVCLTADNGHQATKIRTVLVDSITKADFTYRYCQQVFDNLSACSDQYVWILPDGTTSTAAFPPFKFKAPGTYPIKLIAIKGNKRDTLSTSMTLKGDQLGPPSAVFTFKKISEPSTFEFTALDSTENRYIWYFGDQTFSDTSGYKVIHTIDKEKYQSAVSLWVSNACGFTSFDLDPFATTGMENADFDNSITVFPNPASDEVRVTISTSHLNKAIIRLIDINGKVVKAAHLPTSDLFEIRWNVSDLVKGIYLIQVMDDRRILNKKIVVN